MKPMSVSDKALKAMSDDKKMIQSTDNASYTLHNLDLLALPPIDIRVCSCETLEKRCVDYFEICIRNDMKPSMAGFALALGCARTSLFDYINGAKKIAGGNREILAKYNNVLNALIEDYMQNGKINPVAGIFISKNNFGYKDSQEFVLNNNTQDEATPEALMQEAQLLIDSEGTCSEQKYITN